ncbi:MAG: GNAT family N-acetyltransferase [Blastocatellales bacterium]
MPRGLMDIGDGGGLKDTLRKKKQSKINRLRRLGDLHLDRIQTPEEMGAIFDEVTCCQTLRLRAIHNLTDSPYDPLKKAFTMKLMRLPGMIHATALRLDDKLISAQIHTYNREQVLLGLITHWPSYARYSPGELHLLMTGVELAKEGIPVFDLTPGGHYKDRYATRHDEVYIITIFFNRLHCIQYKFKRRMAEAAKSTTRVFNITPEKAKDAFSNAQDWRRKWSLLKPASLLSETFREMKKHTWQTDELCVYVCNLDQAHNLPDLRLMNRDHIPDLFCYQPEEAWQPPVNKFMRQALENLEAGHHFYTWVEDGKLKQYGWLIEQQERKAPTVDGQDFGIPVDGVLLTDYFTSSEGRNLSKIALCQMLRDAANTPGAKQAYICIPAEHRALRRLVEGVGFTYQCSSFRKSRLGKATHWSAAQLAR